MGKIANFLLVALVNGQESYQSYSDGPLEGMNDTQIAHFSHQTPQISNQTPQISNQMPQNSYQECAQKLTATCDFGTGNGEDGYGTINGILQVYQYIDCPGVARDRQPAGAGPVMFQGELMGASANFLPGYHGLHVHAGSDMFSCAALGGHMTSDGPDGPNEIHGPASYETPERHAGDLGNIMVGDNYLAEVSISDNVVSLDPYSDYYIGDHGMVLHALMDDGNPTRDPSSTGAAGARVGCCLLTHSAPVANLQQPQVSDQTPQISNQYPQMSNQYGQVSNQVPQVSNQTPQVSNQTPQV